MIGKIIDQTCSNSFNIKDDTGKADMTFAEDAIKRKDGFGNFIVDKYSLDVDGMSLKDINLRFLSTVGLNFYMSESDSLYCRQGSSKQSLDSQNQRSAFILQLMMFTFISMLNLI